MPKVNGQAFSISLVTQLSDLCTALVVCPELLQAAQQKLHIIELQVNAVRVVTYNHVIALWHNCNIGKLPIADEGEDGCEYRAHAICELINAADSDVGAKFLGKFWIDAGQPLLGPKKWVHHVAPVVFAQGMPYIFDPLLVRDRALSLDEWRHLLGTDIQPTLQAWERLGKPVANNPRAWLANDPLSNLANDPLSQLGDWFIDNTNARAAIDRAKHPTT